VVEIVDNGEKIGTTARLVGILVIYLKNHLYGNLRSRKQGPQGVLSRAKEDDLVESLLKMQDLGNPLTPTDLQLKVA
jgi:hypothetical protein